MNGRLQARNESMADDLQRNSPRDPYSQQRRRGPLVSINGETDRRRLSCSKNIGGD